MFLKGSLVAEINLVGATSAMNLDGLDYFHGEGECRQKKASSLGGVNNKQRNEEMDEKIFVNDVAEQLSKFIKSV